MTKIAVTELEYKKARAVFDSNPNFKVTSAPADENRLAQLVKAESIKHVVIGVEKYEQALYDALPKGGVIARFGVGHDGVDKQKATEKGLFCTNTPGALDDSVAEHAFNLILAAARHTVAIGSKMLNSNWAPVVGSELKGKTLAVIGLGPIGRRVAQLAAFGFQMKVIASEVQEVDPLQMLKEYGVERIENSFEAAVANADFISLHIPVNAHTKHFINSKSLKAISPNSWLINTSRGTIVNENDLYDALLNGKIKGAALDVFEIEPYQPLQQGKDLRALSNIIMTPHVGSSTVEASDRMAQQCLDNILLAEKGEYMKMNLLNQPL